MATIAEFQQRLSRIASKKSLELILFTEIKRHEKIFVRYNKEQLSKGENNEGEIIGTYTEATEEMAADDNPRQPKIAGQPYNFEYTGGLFDGFELRVFEDNAYFFSTDSKTPELVSQYKGLFGLQEDNLREIIKTVIIPAFVFQIRKELNLI